MKNHDSQIPTAAEPLPMDRREFLRLSAALTATAALASAGCKMPVETVVPTVARPEELRRLGKPLFYATTLEGRPAMVRTREGRPILIGPNPGHPAVTTTTLRTEARILDLYDPDRASGPQSVRRGKGLPAPLTWTVVTDELVSALKGKKGKAVLLMGGVPGPATRDALRELETRVGLVTVAWNPLAPDTSFQAWNALFNGTQPTTRLEKARLLVGLGADFLDDPKGDEAQRFMAARDPDAQDGMARFVAFEGRLSLTGAAADQRIRVRPSHLPPLAGALAREVIVTRGVGPLAGDPTVAAALAPFDLATVAKRAGLDPDTLKRLVDDLVAAAGTRLVVTGDAACAQAGGRALAAAVHLLNLSLGAWGNTLTWGPEDPVVHGGSTEALARLVQDMNGGQVDLLLLYRANPVYDAPASLKFAEAMSKVPRIVSLNDRIDETTALADILAPASHPLECWGDGRVSRGTWGIQQPAIRPLLDTRGFLDILLSLGAAVDATGPMAEAWRASRDQPGAPAPNPSPAWFYLRAWARWTAYAALSRPPAVVPLPGPALPGAEPEFDAFWNDALRKGYLQDPPETLAPPTLVPAGLGLLAEAGEGVQDGLELALFPHYALHDGSSANNGWLLEFSDPLTRIAWSDWVALAPRRFDAMGLKNGDLVEVSVNGQKLTLPAYRQAGLHMDVLAIPLGLGRTAVGQVGNGVGHNLFPAAPVEGGRIHRTGLPATVRATGGFAPLPLAQGSEIIDRTARPLLPATALSDYKANPKAGTEQTPGGPSAYKDHPYEGQRWAMAIDLTRCTGCGICAMACRGENNIPVVGQKGCVDRREMSWLRIDRYYDTPTPGEWPDSVWDGPLEVVEEPRTLFEPMMCQHCENAPCETVCPFTATMHSADGLNQQVYNRCVGTFFCANNCPFKVRRFNWYDYSQERTNALFTRLVPIMKEHGKLNARGHIQLKNNPEVTVRSRGVMEKCSFCVQRIREARELARVEGRDPGKLQDGEVRPACMEACPTGAIVFGDIHDPTSRVAQLSQNPRAMKLLELLGIRPSISYLTKVRNDS